MTAPSPATASPLPSGRRRGAPGAISGFTPAPGFTLIEAVVALAVLGVGMLLLGSLLIQAHTMLAQAGIEARVPLSEPVLDRLRSEIQGATGIDAGPAPLPGWSRDRLTLVFPDGRRARYETDGPRLMRSDFVPAAPGAAASWGAARPVLGEVLSWRWEVAGSRLLTVEVTYRDVDPRDPVLDPVGPITPPKKWRTREITAALRGGGLGWGW